MQIITQMRTDRKIVHHKIGSHHAAKYLRCIKSGIAVVKNLATLTDH